MKDVHAGKALTVGEVTITPLEKVKKYRGTSRKGAWVYFHKEPVGIIIDSPSGRRFVDLDGENMPTDADISADL